jgi:hypothetical protein
MNKAVAVIALGALCLVAWTRAAGADERAEIAAGVASCVNAAMAQGHRSEAFSVAYCQCVIPKIVRSMPASLRQSATKEQAESFSMRWLEQNPVALGACLKSGDVAEGKS